MTEFSFFEYLKVKQVIVNEYLAKLIPGENTFPSSIHRSMHYSLMAGGKRLRPILALATAESIGADIYTVLPFACAIELIHTYSLIHDDLPAMDNDDFRRGKPTCHKAFGEALAILAGDALLTQAFLILSSPEIGTGVDPVTRLTMIKELSDASGSKGMIGGQVLDLEAQNKNIEPEELSIIHKLKTGRLIRASIRIGALAAHAQDKELSALTAYGENVGLAFQIMDDILDLEGTEEKLGKTANSDLFNQKATYPLLFGFEESKEKAIEAVNLALSAIGHFDHKAEPLRHIAHYTITREQ